MTYDSGDYAKIMDRTLALADWKGFAKRKRERKRSGRLRGIGLANYLEITSGAPREWSKVDVQPEGRVDVSDRHAVERPRPRDELRAMRRRMARRRRSTASGWSQGDTDIVPVGGGSHSGRSMRMGGVVMGKASEAVIQKATRIAGHVLETDAADVAFAEGRFTVKGTDRSVGLFEVARAARDPQRPARRSARPAGRGMRRDHPRSRASRSAARSARSRSIPTPA